MCWVLYTLGGIYVLGKGDCSFHGDSCGGLL
ncbi:unnamed protein product [Spirodela intermedia]|uniref:Uncharacterized protein n=1 Tax=Spirodela intermedia TaxID=51605 RepID=A0A7I8JRP6_SPIIN|nr:unnamed protein product [Spirodela intermedia]CAA6672856.1 unnamed protein product [Spirodela intermedia]